MMNDILKAEQPVLYETLCNMFRSERIPHAFLISAKKGVNVHDVAMFIAQSLLCDDALLACENCITCMRVKEGNYGDVIWFDGHEESIKKKHIQQIQERFKTTAMEGKNRIYVLEAIDYSSAEAMNSLLKMLEEPQPGIFAILTCENPNAILPTIQSRCQMIHFNAQSNHALAMRLIQEGIEETDARILSNIFDSPEEIKALLEDSKKYTYLKEEAVYFIIEYFTKSKDVLALNCQSHALKEYPERNDVQFFLQLLFVGFRDVLYLNYDIPVSFINYEAKLKALLPINEEKVISVLEKILDAKSQLSSNGNVMLVMDRLMYEL